MYSIAVYCAHPSREPEAQALSQALGLPLLHAVSKEYSALLIFTDHYLMLRLTENHAPGPIFVDFIKGALAYRRQWGGGKNQLIARAVGISPKEKLSVLDATAGLGRDAFVLATLGCDVILCEKSPIMIALLKDGLRRAQSATWFSTLSLKLIHVDSLLYLSEIPDDNRPDVIYLDPMFPDKTKTALAKKEMRILKAVVGMDCDVEALLTIALQKAKKRVVVKRARRAPSIGHRKPDVIFNGNSIRFDVYIHFTSKSAT